MLKRQGVNVKGLLKSTPPKEEPQPYIDCTGNLQVLSKALFSFICLLFSSKDMDIVFIYVGCP